MLGIREVLMNPAEYEKVVADIVRDILQSSGEHKHLLLGSGRNNRIPGASGYHHQIDVSIHGPSLLYLIECKRWKDKIGLAEVLVLAARMNDIQDHFRECSVIGIFGCLNSATGPAKQVAEHYKIIIEIVHSSTEFGLRVGRHVAHGILDSLSISDEVDVCQKRKGRFISV